MAVAFRRMKCSVLFLRHSTSKIETVEDLSHIASLGFRGEALSSIAAVTRTELITKTADAEFGTRYVIEGGKRSILGRYRCAKWDNFPRPSVILQCSCRRKFLKTPMTEAGHVQDLLMHLALSHPEVAFQFLNNGQEKTSYFRKWKTERCDLQCLWP